MAITVSYLDIQDSIATGTTWRAPLVSPFNNINSGNNTNWKFEKLIKDFFLFLNLPVSLSYSDLFAVPRLQYTDIQDCVATGTTWIATTSTGNINSGNNSGFDFTSNLTINEQ
jgi:hypothetical protein